MPFGAHETMEAHEALNELINMLDHFSLYKTQTRDPVLSQMIDRHTQTAIQAYNQLVSYTHDYQSVQPAAGKSTAMGQQQVQYGLRQPSQQQPQIKPGSLDDRQIATAMLIAHKNSAKNSIVSSLECADPNVRQIMVNRAVNCVTEAYEVFQYMNQRGYYQIPTMESHTAKTMLHSYQPAQGIQPIQHTQQQAMQPLGQPVSFTQSAQPMQSIQSAYQQSAQQNLITAYSPQSTQQRH